MKKNSIRLFLVISMLAGSSFRCGKDPSLVNPVPDGSRQLVLVVTAGADSTNGSIFCYERNNDASIWHDTRDGDPVVIGRAGLAWGRGLHHIDTTLLAIKKEGDRRSPAGVFRLGEAFGFLTPEEIGPTRYPYFQIKGKMECVDDSGSDHYNQILDRDAVLSVDWTSSERMYLCHGFYDLGVIVEHNTVNTIKGGGSCIFLHIWTAPDEASTGCTTMSPEMMQWLITWLDADKEPVLVQLPQELYSIYRQRWKLPLTE